MHEVSIVENIVHIVSEKAKENNLKKINKVSLMIGELSGVMPDALIFAFQCVSKGTLLAGADLLIQRMEATAECEHCGKVFKIDHFNKICPECQRFSSNILTGYELYINTMEGD